MKATSIKSYYELVESGELSKKQIAVANCFRKNGPMTGRQVTNIIPGAWRRINELVDMGVISPTIKMYDVFTRKVVQVWGWTGDQPLLVPIKADKTKRLSPLYDKAYEQGARDILFRLGYTKEAIEDEISILKEAVK